MSNTPLLGLDEITHFYQCKISLIEIVRAIIEFIGFIKCTAFLGILEIGDPLLQRINLVQDGLVAGLGFY